MTLTTRTLMMLMEDLILLQEMQSRNPMERVILILSLMRMVPDYTEMKKYNWRSVQMAVVTYPHL